ncbi:hypothetical protein [Trichlorobacter lovleyi]|uniref:Uncharacterized protein n=1 Tax=Trichlorobacter lovleyi (strain ATCC BAA-1151 / DSM 17278 / SZ) TaxID=398767 RepID=B3EAX4_TRIL1|nr:hypothetical protein [Trichlorobacter lovleyi]ACD93958.1 hypothetical protein Glov_0227 [Trichlorobacter lovleyi SZ]
MRYLFIMVLLITCSTSSLAETGRGWSPWYKLDDGGLNGIEFSHKNDCPPGGTAACNLQWRFSSAYETPVEIEYTIAWENGGPQKRSERVNIQPGVNVSDAFTVKGAALDEVTVRLISDKKILAEARKEVTAELKRQEDERKRKEEAARKAELARKAEQARQEKLAQAAALPYTPGEAAEVTQLREETAREIEEDLRQQEEKRREERLAEEQRQEREREQRAEEERRAQISRDEEEKKAQTRRDEEREAREWREKREAQEAEDRQSTRDYNASIGAQIMQNINNNAATLARIDRQTSAAINESNRVRAAQAAERDRARAEKEEREADRRRDAERDRAARADAQRTADARRVQEDARIRQQEQERQQKQARLEEQAQAQEQARQQEQTRKQEQARKRAEAERAKLASGSGGSSVGPSAEKIYICPSREYFTSLMHYRAKNVETFTFEEACARAEQKAADFVAGVGKSRFKDFADKRVVKNVDACRKTKSGDQVVVYVNLEGPELRPCGTASTGVSR